MLDSLLTFSLSIGVVINIKFSWFNFSEWIEGEYCTEQDEWNDGITL